MPEDTTSDDSKADSVLSRKLKKILDSKLESDKDTVDALKELSTFFQDNNLKTRRNLRGEIERRNLQINHDFLSAFQTVKESLDSLHSNVVGMSESCQTMQARLSASKSVTHQLMRQTTEVQSATRSLQMQQEVAMKFRDRLSLSQGELEVLQAKPGQHRIDQEFFTVLEKVGRIHRDCRVLLAAGHQTAALGTMDRMAEVQEAALDRLYRWAQSAVRNTEIGDNGPQLAKALHHLQERELLFQYVVEEYTSSRRAAMVRSFIEALTVGGPGGTPRPIEMHAHEPTRYVGDMLAWLHQACPGEAENISQLLRLCDQVEKEKVEAKILSGTTEGVCRPLKTRVEQILVSEPGAVVLYRLTNLIRFYENTINGVLKVPSGLSTTLTELQQLSYSQFMSMLQSSVTSHLARVEGGVGDLAPAPATTSLLGLLRDVLAGHSVVDASQDDLPVILSCVADPLTHQLHQTAASLPSQDGAVFMINNLHQLRTTLSLYQTTEARLKELSTQIDTSLASLSKDQATHLLSSLSLLPMTPLLSSGGDGTPLSTVPGCHPQAVLSCASRLDSLLSAPDILLLPATRLLLSSQHRRQVTQHAFKELLSVYSSLHTAVSDPTNGYDPSLLSKTPDQVSQLLQL
eukprot:GFUD01016021.1.p1 GENE.GFUD01016021.1~~GFUD01016021.1.p1  ORF type:complete len:631 (+),score=243.67 GFUD01016021.1:52-1944(+)